MCECIKKANEVLRPHNTVLDVKLSFTADMKKQLERIHVPTRKISSRGKRAMVVWANYCPLCGEKAEASQS
jgi:hypothetical protein